MEPLRERLAYFEGIRRAWRAVDRFNSLYLRFVVLSVKIAAARAREGK